MNNKLVVTSGDREVGRCNAGVSGEGLVWDRMKSRMKLENCKELKESVIQFKNCMSLWLLANFLTYFSFLLGINPMQVYVSLTTAPRIQ